MPSAGPNPRIIVRRPTSEEQSMPRFESSQSMHMDPGGRTREKGPEQYLNLEDLLWECEWTNYNKESFWPPHSLRCIFTEERIREEMGESRALTVSDQILSDEPQYIKVFALLLITGRGNDIAEFLDAKVNDGLIPFDKFKDKYGNTHIIPRDGQHTEAIPTSSWTLSEKHNFLRWQFNVDIPFLQPESDGRTASHRVFDGRTILPWLEQKTVSQGGFGTVYRVTMHSTCHKFQIPLKEICTDEDENDETNEISVFALKELHEDSKDVFKNEIKLLKRFTGLDHPHLVTLLMTFNLAEKCFLLFPWAGCDLEKYWGEVESRPQIDAGVDSVQWISAQIVGIVGALNRIHEPGHLPSQFGRHGDLKPGNILWYRSPNHNRGILVIADLGLASLNSLHSRSGREFNMENIGTPDYRPPETDLKGGTISRAYDMWTLGCILLELTCWAIGGEKMRQQFIDEKRTIGITGLKSAPLFDIKKDKENNFVIMIKETVTKVVRARKSANLLTSMPQWITRLHGESACTEYFHNLLDIIEENMIICLAETDDGGKRNRISSTVLLRKVQEMDTLIIRNPDYGNRKCPRRRSNPPTIAYKAILAQRLDDALANMPNLQVKVHTGRTRNALTGDELAKLR